eukprot:Lithocolla_globosa_v1_NODE_580_length_3691_cov_16.982398.p1 type:complete len:671 gc:universal NODE_580_length_3691_cov_16.982398:1450-3462(+)
MVVLVATIVPTETNCNSIASHRFEFRDFIELQLTLTLPSVTVIAGGLASRRIAFEFGSPVMDIVQLRPSAKNIHFLPAELDVQVGATFSPSFVITAEKSAVEGSRTVHVKVSINLQLDSTHSSGLAVIPNPIVEWVAEHRMSLHLLPKFEKARVVPDVLKQTLTDRLVDISTLTKMILTDREDSQEQKLGDFSRLKLVLTNLEKEPGKSSHFFPEPFGMWTVVGHHSLTPYYRNLAWRRVGNGASNKIANMEEGDPIHQLIAAEFRKNNPNNELRSIQLLHCPVNQKSLLLNLAITENRRDKPEATFNPKQESHVDETLDFFKQSFNKTYMIEEGPPTRTQAANTLFTWHSPSHSRFVTKIIDDGFANLSRRYNGFFGSGIYSTVESAYACDKFPAAAGIDGQEDWIPDDAQYDWIPVLFCVASVGVSRVINPRDHYPSNYSSTNPAFSSFYTKEQNGLRLSVGYDSHLIPVAYRGPVHKYQACWEDDEGLEAHELVLDQGGSLYSCAVVWYVKKSTVPPDYLPAKVPSETFLSEFENKEPIRLGQESTVNVKEPVNAEKSITCTFNVRSGADSDKLFLVGGVPELGSWCLDKAQAMSKGEDDVWTVSCTLSDAACKTPIEFKLVKQVNGQNTWEEGNNRSVEAYHKLAVDCVEFRQTTIQTERQTDPSS